MAQESTASAQTPQQPRQITNPSPKQLPKILKENPHAVKDYLRQTCKLQEIVQYSCDFMKRNEAIARAKGSADTAAPSSESQERLDEPVLPERRSVGHLREAEPVLVKKKVPEKKEIVCEEVTRFFRQCPSGIRVETTNWLD